MVQCSDIEDSSFEDWILDCSFDYRSCLCFQLKMIHFDWSFADVGMVCYCIVAEILNVAVGSPSHWNFELDSFADSYVVDCILAVVDRDAKYSLVQRLDFAESLVFYVYLSFWIEFVLESSPTWEVSLLKLEYHWSLNNIYLTQRIQLNLTHLSLSYWSPFLSIHPKSIMYFRIAFLVEVKTMLNLSFLFSYRNH